MNTSNLFKCVAGAAIFALASMTAAIAADSFPTRPVRIVVPTAPGGTLDLTTRLVAQKMAENLGQPVIVDNRPGGDTLLGTRIVKDANPDGYTILAQAEGMLIAPYIKLEAGYDPIKDFTGVGQMLGYPFIMEVGSDQPDHTLADFIARAKANPGKLSYGSAGLGTPPHISAALFLLKAGLDVTHIPYKGNGPALPDVAGGRVDMIFDGYISSTAYLKAGKLRPLAVTSTHRIAPLPDVPTFIEQNVDYNYPSWNALFAPAGTPKEVMQRLSDALKYALNDKQLSERFRSEGSTPTFITPAEFSVSVEKQFGDFGEVIAALNIPKQ